jgi:predicted peroxiredoxin
VAGGSRFFVLCREVDTVTKIAKNVSIMCFHEEFCQVYNALMTALSLLREGSKVTMFFGSRGIYAVHREKVKTLACLPDQPKAEGDAVMRKMDELNLPSVEDLFFMLIAEGATVLACPLNAALFNISAKQLIDGVKIADPSKYYKETVIPADMNLTF